MKLLYLFSVLVFMLVGCSDSEKINNEIVIGEGTIFIDVPDRLNTENFRFFEVMGVEHVVALATVYDMNDAPVGNDLLVDFDLNRIADDMGGTAWAPSRDVDMALKDLVSDSPEFVIGVKWFYREEGNEDCNPQDECILLDVTANSLDNVGEDYCIAGRTMGPCVAVLLNNDGDSIDNISELNSRTDPDMLDVVVPDNIIDLEMNNVVSLLVSELTDIESCRVLDDEYQDWGLTEELKLTASIGEEKTLDAATLGIAHDAQGNICFKLSETESTIENRPIAEFLGIINGQPFTIPDVSSAGPSFGFLSSSVSGLTIEPDMNNFQLEVVFRNEPELPDFPQVSTDKHRVILQKPEQNLAVESNCELEGSICDVVVSIFPEGQPDTPLPTDDNPLVDKGVTEFRLNSLDAAVGFNVEYRLAPDIAPLNETVEWRVARSNNEELSRIDNLNELFVDESANDGIEFTDDGGKATLSMQSVPGVYLVRLRILEDDATTELIDTRIYAFDKRPQEVVPQ